MQNDPQDKIIIDVEGYEEGKPRRQRSSGEFGFRVRRAFFFVFSIALGAAVLILFMFFFVYVILPVVLLFVLWIAIRQLLGPRR